MAQNHTGFIGIWFTLLELQECKGGCWWNIPVTTSPSQPSLSEIDSGILGREEMKSAFKCLCHPHGSSSVALSVLSCCGFRPWMGFSRADEIIWFADIS